MPPIDPDVLVVGLPRSGTTIFARYICSQKNLCYFQEAQWITHKKRNLKISRKKKKLIIEHWNHFVKYNNHEPFSKYISEIEDMISSKVGINPWLDHCPQNFKVLDKFSSKTKVYVVTRRPEDIYLSMMKTSWGKITQIRFAFQVSRFIKCIKKAKQELIFIKYEDFVKQNSGKLINVKYDYFGTYGINSHHKNSLQPIFKKNMTVSKKYASLLLLKLLPPIREYKSFFNY